MGLELNASVETGIGVREYRAISIRFPVVFQKDWEPHRFNDCWIKTFHRRSVSCAERLGGGMRQIGIIAAAGFYALKNNIARLKDDHERPKYWQSGSHR